MVSDSDLYYLLSAWCMIMISVNVIIQNRQATETPPTSTVLTFDCETDCPMSMDLTGYCKFLY